MTYTAVYEREGDGRWTVEIPAVPGCHSYGRTVDEARKRIREALGLYVRHADRIRIVDDIRLERDAQEAVSLMAALRRQLETIQAELPRAEEEAIRALRKGMGLGQRDAGTILGLSFQRIHQIEKRKAS